MSLYSDLNEVLTPYANKIKELDASDDQIKAGIQTQIGNLSNLTTSEKSSLVGAINEVAQSGGGSGGGLTEAVKAALLNCFDHVAWSDDDGQTYYDALYDALNPTTPPTPATLTSITCVYSGGSVASSTSLDSLKSDLVVTAHYSDQTTAVIGDSAYTLSGTLVADTTSTITVAYGGKATSFTVSVNSDTPTHLYVIDDETLFTRGKGCGNNAPNYISNGARISYNHFDILVEAGKTYRATAQSTYDTAYMAVRLTSEGGRTNVANGVNIAGTQDNDSGWQGLTYDFTVPSNFGTSAARFVFKQDSAGSTVSDDWSITEIVIDEVTA